MYGRVSHTDARVSQAVFVAHLHQAQEVIVASGEHILDQVSHFRYTCNLRSSESERAASKHPGGGGGSTAFSHRQ